MACYYPSLALDLGLVDGVHRIKFLSRRYDTNINQLREIHGDNLLLLPCGHCLGCKCDKAKDWATRCYLESLYHLESCFVTLTYDDEHCPLTIQKSDVLDFIKDLRNRGIKCRFFGCCELGHKTQRPHAHIILFGYKPSDLVLYSKGSNGDFLYTSSFLSSLWMKGHVIVGDCSFHSAGYVARYTTKKLGDDGSCLFMSLKPGIGMQWIYQKENQDYVFKYDNIPGSFGSMSFVPVPHAFNKYLKKINPEKYRELVNGRLAKAKIFDGNKMNLLRFGHLEEVKSYESKVLDSKLKNLERSLD